MRNKIVAHEVCFNSKMVNCTGTVIVEYEDNWLVDFEHDKIKYRGLWSKKDCKKGDHGQDG
jgi:hypothetical protein